MMGQSKRIQDLFQTTIKVDKSKVALKGLIKGLDKISDIKIPEFIKKSVQSIYSRENLESKIKLIYPSYIEGTIEFLNDFNPNAKQAIVFVDLEDFGVNKPILFNDTGSTSVSFSVSIQIILDV